MDRRKFLGTLAGAVAVAGHAKPRSAGAAEGSAKPASGSLPTRPLGQTGVNVTVLVLGGVAGMKIPPSDEFHPAELASAALDAGVRYFDTAPAYNNGQSERNYGEVIAHRRNEVFLATKTGGRSYDGAMRDIEASLKRLRTDHVDLLQIHGLRGDEEIEPWGKSDGVYAALLKLREQKVTRFLGVTGHDSAKAMRRAIEMYDFDTILTTFNPTKRRQPFQRLVLPVARKKNMGILAMKLLGGGLGSLAKGNPIKNDGVSYHDEAPRQAEAGRLIRYALGLPITAAVVGMGSLEHLKTNTQAVRELPPLSRRERESLQEFMA
jgi:aryl-alcohol dehydrogenase-like predicted oxidoreductase